MYKLSIPVSPYFTEQRREQTFEELARAKADRVFVTQPNCLSTEEVKRNSLEFLRRELPVLREKGYEVGVWINAFGHGGDSDLEKAIGKKAFQDIVSPYVVKPEGKPELVPLSDRRKPISSAQSDFAE